MKKDHNLEYVCYFIEYAGRELKQTRGYIATKLGFKGLKNLYDYADVFHCDNILKVIAEHAEIYQLEIGEYCNVSRCLYKVPAASGIASTYRRLIQGVYDGELSKNTDIIEICLEIYNSFLSDEISEYNTDFFYQPPQYHLGCYKSGKVLE